MGDPRPGRPAPAPPPGHAALPAVRHAPLQEDPRPRRPEVHQVVAVHEAARAPL